MMDENAAPLLEDASADCRHCGSRLTRLQNGHWIDANAMYGCIKGGLPGSGRGPVLHEPMPAGLHGAPS